MSSPYEHILSWFMDLSPLQRQQVAKLVGTAMPSIELSIDREIIAGQLLAELRALNDGPRRELGLTLCLRSLIQHQVIDSLGKAPYWEAMKRSYISLSQKYTDESFLKMADETEFLSALWMASRKKWEKMALLHLTDKNLTAFYAPLHSDLSSHN